MAVNKDVHGGLVCARLALEWCIAGIARSFNGGVVGVREVPLADPVRRSNVGALACCHHVHRVQRLQVALWIQPMLQRMVVIDQRLRIVRTQALPAGS